MLLFQWFFSDINYLCCFNPHYQGGGFPVAEHFNLLDHDKISDMRVSVVNQVNSNTARRQCEEKRGDFQAGNTCHKGLERGLQTYLI